jgi:hypothetical protein
MITEDNFVQTEDCSAVLVYFPAKVDSRTHKVSPEITPEGTNGTLITQGNFAALSYYPFTGEEDRAAWLHCNL